MWLVVVDTSRFSHQCIRLCISLVEGHSESGQVLLYLLDQRTVPLHQSIQSRHRSPLLHFKVGQGNPQVLVQNGMDLLIFPDDILPYH